MKILKWGWIAVAALAAVGVQAQTQAAVAPRHWEFGPFVDYGNGLMDRSDFHMLMVGFQAGKVISPLVHAGPFSGRFEYGVNVMPLFQAYTPKAHDLLTAEPGGDGSTTTPIGGGTFTGASVTPVVFRWNFGPEHKRVLPWFQAQAGVLWTNHKFPPDVEVPEGTPGGTSVWNFRSGAGVGMHYFTNPRRSVDFALNAEHISSASLGDRNPGVNASLQIQVGYTWWK
ncbi:MAG TPA: acyloxyacyl hydrolase [Acidobacteriaceae bacterium]|nr:acyloxyacyl hydrolase [Acidobacteriaceae bacterium]